MVKIGSSGHFVTVREWETNVANGAKLSFQPKQGEVFLNARECRMLGRILLALAGE